MIVKLPILKAGIVTLPPDMVALAVISVQEAASLAAIVSPYLYFTDFIVFWLLTTAYVPLKARVVGASKSF